MHRTAVLATTIAGLLSLGVLATVAPAQSYPALVESPELDQVAATSRDPNEPELPVVGSQTTRWPSVSRIIHGSVRGSQANQNADHALARWLDCRSQNNALDLEWFGYVQQGVTFNPASPVNRTNGPVVPNYRSNAYQFHGLYLVSQRKIDAGSDRIQFGGRADLVYGTDGTFSLSDGLDENISSGHRFYKLAIPQIYGNLFLPVGRGVSFKFGKFFTPVGNEGLYNPNNFFYSYFNSFNIQPGNHTGVLAEAELTDRLDLRFGPNLGWDTSENSNKAISYAGDLRWQSIDKQTELTFAMQTGHQRTSIVTADSLVTVYSLIFKRSFNSRVHYLLEHDLLTSRSRAGVAVDNYEAYSLANYLFYDLNEAWKAGVRFEWLRDDDGFLTDFGSNQSLGPASYYEVTLGLSWQPRAHIRVRPEIRFDQQVRDDNSTPAAFDDGNSTSQWLFGCDILWEF